MPVVRMLTLAFAKTFSKLFGMATIAFFGRAPTRDDDKLGLVGVLSLSWLFVAIAVFVPPLAETLFPFLPDDEAVVRAVAVAAALAIPPLIGIIITRMENRDGGLRAVLREAVFGFGYAAVIGTLVVALILVVPIVKISYIFRLFDLKHIAVMIAPEDYDDVLDAIRERLDAHGIHTSLSAPPRPLQWIFRGMTAVEGKIFRRRMSRQMTVLEGHIDGDDRWFEITVHATDIAVIGRREETTCIMAILCEELDERNVYFSWDDGSQALEDRILEYQTALADGEAVELDAISALCGDLRELALSSEEWNAIRRQLYRLERDWFRAQAYRAQADASAAEPAGA